MNANFSAIYVGNSWLGSPIHPFGFTRLLEALEEIRRPTRGETWLDLGCNQGQLICVLREKYGMVGTGMDDCCFAIIPPPGNAPGLFSTDAVSGPLSG
jgi:hypothetical protein